MSKNGERLRQLIDDSGINSDEALVLCNRGRIQPWTVKQWHSFGLDTNAEQWKPCPDSVVERMETVHRDLMNSNKSSGNPFDLEIPK